MLPVTVHVPVTGSYSSALRSAPTPPTTNTFPLANSTAECPQRDRCRLPVVAHVSETGSKSSALVKGFPPLSRPPVTNTFPLVSKVAVWLPRKILRLYVLCQKG